MTIADNDFVPVVLSWEQAAVTAEEATSPGSTRPVSLSAVAVTTKDKRPESGFSFDVTVATADGSATQPADYLRLSDTATFSRSDFSLTTVSGQRRYRAVKTFTVSRHSRHRPGTQRDLHCDPGLRRPQSAAPARWKRHGDGDGDHHRRHIIYRGLEYNGIRLALPCLPRTRS